MGEGRLEIKPIDFDLFSCCAISIYIWGQDGGSVQDE